MIQTASLPDIGQRLQPIESIGLMISTCGTPAYVHLQLEAAKRMFGIAGVPILVCNDGNTDESHSAGELSRLAGDYNAAFVCGDYKGHSTGDIRSIQWGLEWAEMQGVQLLVKFSRRFIPLKHWRYGLLCLAANNQHAAAFARFHNDDENSLFRTDAIAFRVAKWQNEKVRGIFEESIAFNTPQRVHVENICNSLQKVLGGFERWDLLGKDFYRATPTAMQWRGCLPCHYGDLAREWGLPYADADFDQNPKSGGILMQSDFPRIEPPPTAAKSFGRLRDEEAVLRARECEFADRCKPPGDIHEHLPLLRELAGECDHVTEFGLRGGNSTVALLCGAPKVLVSYDKYVHRSTNTIYQLAGNTEVRLIQADVLRVDIEPTDLLFIDTLHTYSQLAQELTRHGDKARKYIVFHDTTTFGQKGEDDKEPGLMQAIHAWVSLKPSWKFKHVLTNCNGLTVLERKCDEATLASAA